MTESESSVELGMSDSGEASPLLLMSLIVALAYDLFKIPMQLLPTKEHQ
jgi:hypothetical protein